ncbi:MAG: UvrD-helicase domain-containing protein [Planctomycetia bacterium]|nr:UvrD-helicase domain-containing protein [Planctomycetia bacterium]
MNFPYHRIIRASAGSGKTHRLTTRYLGLILSGEPPESILAVTFTRTAAGEILERILERLLDALEEEGYKRLLDSLQQEGFEELHQMLKRAGHTKSREDHLLPTLRLLLAQLHRCQISTLDAFFAKLATGFTYECGLTPGWKILDSDVQAKIRSSSIQQILETQGPRGARQMMHRLNKGNLGSQVAVDLENLVTGFHEKSREFPSTAWQIPEPVPGPTSKELESAWDSLLKFKCPLNKSGKEDNRWKNALASTQNNWDDPDLLARVKSCKSGLIGKVLNGEFKYYSTDITPDLAEPLEIFIQNVRSEFIQLLRKQNESTGEFLELYDQVRERGLQKNSGLDYFDVPIALIAARVLGQPGLIDERIDATIRHMLLDEFQDTSLVQYVALLPIMEELAAGSQEGRSLFCVGDGKQAIYGWRGGRAEVMDQFETLLLPESGSSLDESWRSSEPVLNTVNKVFSQLASFPPKPEDQGCLEKWSNSFDQHRVAQLLGDRPDGHVSLRIASEYEGKVEKIWPYHETLAEVDRLRSLSKDSSIAILVRKNRHISKLVAALRARGIEASEERGNPLVDSPAVGRVVALLELIEHPGDGTLQYAVENSPLPQILKCMPQLDLAEVADEELLDQAIIRLRALLYDEGFADTIYSIVNTLSLQCSEEDQSRLDQLIEQIRVFGFHGLRLEDLIQNLRQNSVPRPGGSPVQVMTIHQAKGLEYDAVIMPELDYAWFQPVPKLLTLEENGQQVHLSRYLGEADHALVGDPYPEMSQQSRDRKLSETMCLLYVAMTRARHTLTMILPPPGKKGNYKESSYAQLLVKTLAPGEECLPGKVIYECGSAKNDSGKSGEEERLRRSVRVEPLIPDAMGQKRTTASKKVTRWTPKRRRALLIGTLVHSVLETISWSTPAQEDIQKTLTSLHPREKDLHQEVLNIVLAALHKENFSSIFDQSATAERLESDSKDKLILEKEISLMTDINGIRFSGVIDRLVLRENSTGFVSAEIIDFKSDNLLLSNEDTLGKYKDQMEWYRKAVHQCWGIPIDKISLLIATTQNGDIEHLEIPT